MKNIKIEKPIILSEFPKSGGSWIVSLLGDALQIPKRDIYVRPGFDLFELSKHPWYKDAANLDFPAESVIKSHELPGSNLIDFDAAYIHLVRDGRDVIVSKWFFDRDFCIQNGITSSFQEEFDEYVEKTARDWSNYVATWAEQSVATINYEGFSFFLSDPVQNLGRVLKTCMGYPNFSQQELEITVSKFTKDKFAASLDALFNITPSSEKGFQGIGKIIFLKRILRHSNW